MAAANQVPVAGLMVIVDCSLNRMTFFVKGASVNQLVRYYPELIYSMNPLATNPSTAMSVYLCPLSALRQRSPEGNLPLQNTRALAPLCLLLFTYSLPNAIHICLRFILQQCWNLLFLPRPWGKVFSCNISVPLRLIPVSTSKSRGSGSSCLKNTLKILENYTPPPGAPLLLMSA